MYARDGRVSGLEPRRLLQKKYFYLGAGCGIFDHKALDKKILIKKRAKLKTVSQG